MAASAWIGFRRLPASARLVIVLAGLTGVACGTSRPTPPPGASCGTGAVGSSLPLDASGWVSASSNPYCIQGAWSWLSDATTGGNTKLTGLSNGTPPYLPHAGMCLQGSTPGGAADNYTTWGAAVQLNLNQATPDGLPMVLRSPPACFTITIAGTGAPGGLTASLCPANNGGAVVCPQVPVAPGPNEVCTAAAALPSWCTPALNTGQTCLPPSLLAQGVQSVAVEANSGAGGLIDFCVASIVPHDAPAPADGGSDRPPDASSSVDAGLVAARPYALHVPAGIDPAAPAPLVIMLHGYGSDGVSAEAAIFHLTSQSDLQGFIYALPNGSLDSQGNRFWNATDACCNFDGSAVDDVAYLNAVIDDVELHHAVDPTRVFVGGHSNGAMMAQVLACRSATRIAALFSYSGALWANTALCTPDDLVSIVELHGDMDPMVPYAGGPNTLYPGSPPYPSAATTVQTWASLDRCVGAVADSGESQDLVPSIPGSETEVAKATLCPRGIDAELWTIQGGGHQDSLADPSFGEQVWKFFSDHPKPMP